MAWNINRVVLVGRLVRDPEIKYTPTNTAVARFTLAVGGKPRGNGSDSVSFIPIVVWGKTAETCKQYLSKGKMVAVDGRLDQRSWKAQDGSARSVIEVVADRVEFLGAAGGSGKPTEAKADMPAFDAGDEANFYYDNTDIDPSPVNPEDPGF
ncbi:MAG: single-stranded DNA-binding protein [Brevinematales bacterium]